MIISKQPGKPMKKRIRPTFSPEFRLESPQLVVDQNYTIREAAKAMNVGIVNDGPMGDSVETRAAGKAL